jgi:CBS domain containing-hemolysin-like protein
MLEAGRAADVFAPSEREIVKEVLSMAVRPVRSIMTPFAKVTWLNVSDDAASLSRKILQTGHAAYPVCRGRFGDLLGVARAPDLVGDLLGKGRIEEHDLETPLRFFEDDTVLDVVERFQSTRVAMVVINDRSGSLTGVVTATDLLHTLIGEPLGPEIR